MEVQRNNPCKTSGRTQRENSVLSVPTTVACIIGPLGYLNPVSQALGSLSVDTCSMYKVLTLGRTKSSVERELEGYLARFILSSQDRVSLCVRAASWICCWTTGHFDAFTFSERTEISLIVGFQPRVSVSWPSLLLSLSFFPTLKAYSFLRGSLFSVSWKCQAPQRVEGWTCLSQMSLPLMQWVTPLLSWMTSAEP